MRLSCTGAANVLASVSGSLPSTSLTMLISPLFSASLSVLLNEASSAPAERSLPDTLPKVVRASPSISLASSEVLFRSPSVESNWVAPELSMPEASETVDDRESICGFTVAVKSDLILAILFCA